MASPENNNRGFTIIDHQDIWQFITESEYYFEEVERDHDQYVFEVPRDEEYSPLDDPISIRWYTTVQKHSNRTHRNGPMMEITPVHTPTEKPLATSERAQRIGTWEKNVRKKIEIVLDRLHNDPPVCPACGRPLVVVKAATRKEYQVCSDYFEQRNCEFQRPYNPD